MSDGDSAEKSTNRLSAFMGALRRGAAADVPTTPQRSSVSSTPQPRASVAATPPPSSPASGAPSARNIASRTWDPKEWEEDKRYVDAMDLYAAGQKRDALQRLDALFHDDPQHLYGRMELFNIAVELGDRDKAEKHADWMIGYLSLRQDTAGVCKAYRDARLAFPEMPWGEKALVQAMLAGDKTQDARVVVDSTRLLLHLFPKSQALPRAMLAGARVQEAEGRPDLARVTLQNIINAHPLDPIAELAKRKLAEME